MTIPKTLQSVLFCIGLSSGCSREPQTIEAPILEQGLREHQDERRKAEEQPKVYTIAELEKMASHQERAGIGMNFYYDELRKRNDAKWAKEELERRKAIR